METERRSLSRRLRVVLPAIVIATALGAGTLTALAQEQGRGGGGRQRVDSQTAESPVRYDLAIAISVAIAVPCLAAGYAVAKMGTAALGAASENPELLGRSLILVGLGEGIAIYGLVLAIMLWLKL
ncbi:MAG: ATP synthase subunit C [Planctomycetota bacterium]